MPVVPQDLFGVFNCFVMINWAKISRCSHHCVHSLWYD
nr:MAG TPA: hypothetical protein [Caudoviricetes sp.]